MKSRLVMVALVATVLALPLLADSAPAPAVPIVGSCVLEEATDLAATLPAVDKQENGDTADKLKKVDPATQGKMKRYCELQCTIACNDTYGQGSAAAEQCICNYCCTRC